MRKHESVMHMTELCTPEGLGGGPLSCSGVELRLSGVQPRDLKAVGAPVVAEGRWAVHIIRHVTQGLAQAVHEAGGGPDGWVAACNE